MSQRGFCQDFPSSRLLGMISLKTVTYTFIVYLDWEKYCASFEVFFDPSNHNILCFVVPNSCRCFPQFSHTLKLENWPANPITEPMKVARGGATEH
jgi:hypothetical protein